MVREKRGGRGGQGEDVWFIKLINLPENQSITLFFYLYGGLEARAKPQAS